MDWLDLLAVQGTLKSFLQHHSSKASILWCSGFFSIQLSHPYMTTGKTIALNRAISSVQFSCSVMPDSLRPHARQASLSITNFRSSPKLMCIRSVIPSSHLILCHPLLLLPSIFPSIRSFQMTWLFLSGGHSIRASASVFQ